jgi:hypothetical protein
MVFVEIVILKANKKEKKEIMLQMTVMMIAKILEFQLPNR